MAALPYLVATLLPGMAELAFAQTPLKSTGFVGGIVQSEDSVPLPLASVSLRRLDDSVTVGATITSANGSFRIDRVESGRYLVEVSHLGYQTATRRVAITDSAERVDLGILRLRATLAAPCLDA